MKKYFKLFLIILFSLCMLFVGCNHDKGSEEEIPDEPVIDEPEEPQEQEEPKEKEYTTEELIEQKDIIFEWLSEKFDNWVIDSDVEIPKKHPDYDLEIEFYSFDDYLDDDGTYNAPILDYESEVLFVIIIEKQEYELFLPVIFKGYGDEFDVINDELKRITPKQASSNIQLRTKLTGHDATLTWTSLNPEAIESDGTVHKLMTENQSCVMICTVIIGDESRDFTYSIIVNKVSELERIGYAKEWLSQNFSVNSEITESLNLPTYLEEYDAYFIWTSSIPTVLSSSGLYKAPFHDEDIVLTAVVRVGVRSESVAYTMKAKGLNLVDMWEKIESFLDHINLDEIKNQKFTLYGSEEGYYSVPSENLGYLPFYDENNLKITQDFLPVSSGLKPDRKRSSTQYVVVHNTGMAAPSATAKGLNDYIHSTTREASWHFAVDDHEAYQHVPIDEIAWHAGDGSHVFGEVWSGGIGGGNQNGVSIETCVYAGIDFSMCMRNLAKLVASLLIQYDLGIDRVKQHWDFSGKDCPQVIRHADRWDELLSLVRLEMFAQTELKDVHFEWTSLSPEIMDDKGRIINHPGNETTVNYKVKVTYDGVTKEYTYSSKLLERK